MKTCLRNCFTLSLPPKFFVTHRVSKPIFFLLAETVCDGLIVLLFIEVFKHSSKPAISLGFQSYPQLWITLLVTYPGFSIKKQRLSYNAKRG